MHRPPRSVALVARTHWLVGMAVAVSIFLLHFLTRNLPIAFSPRTYWITGSLAALYLLSGTLVWFGLPSGRLLSRICGLLYLTRPQFGSYLWDTMNLPDYRAHFTRRAIAPDPGSRDRE
ncbi:MAG: hypothetical protein V4773_25500 [Verrucomicrobiota bacterium]